MDITKAFNALPHGPVLNRKERRRKLAPRIAAVKHGTDKLLVPPYMGMGSGWKRPER